ncbi:RlpA-like double-psi beta-barrel domain-containing protein [Rhizohabitans arisaemae]|uniref:RlpA-like double-psi beta-barrel domain-containing protein n=1 Tax=Rhizohabitans arisaemae TaxID=2720610 RepID=UPI0024B279FB|nr:RlpA-like double-psi beta-barrel domain-containing protein [Rhizohabitans arisaemae]
MRSKKAIIAAVAAFTLATGLAGTAPAGATASGPAHEPKVPAELLTKLPTGSATATSFWDPATASGKPMRYQTIASPYWPLGTKVKVTYQGKSVTGVIEDFGPAEWAVAQHKVPAIIDLSELLMRELTGQRSNVVVVDFEVLEWGKGRVYRDRGTGYDLAFGK